MPEIRHAAVKTQPLELDAATLAATNTNLPCNPPKAFQPLFDLLNSLTELAFLGGIALGMLGFLTAALFILLPGEDYTRRGKKVAKSTFIGTTLLLSSNMILQFLISELGTTICT